MVWVYVLAGLVVAGVGCWLMYGRRRGRHVPAERMVGRHRDFNPDHYRGQVESRGELGGSFRSGIRKDQGPPGF